LEKILLNIQNEIAPLNEPLLRGTDEKEEKQEAAPILSRAEKRWIYFALTIFSFGAGANEFSASGMLPQFADAFGISNTQAAYVQSIYALTVATMGLPATALLVNQPRKKAITGLMLVFIAGSVTSALAQNYSLLMVGRFLSALPHAPFYGISSTTVSLINPGQGGEAIAIVYLGMTLANIAGTPAATWLARQYGWRFPFWTLSGIGGCGLLAILISRVDKIPRVRMNIREELKDFIKKDLKKPGVSLGLLAIAFGFGGIVAFSGYIAPIMIDVAGFGDSDIPWIAATLGIGFTVGNHLGGKLTDGHLTATLYGSLIGLAATLGTLVFVVKYPIPSVFGIFVLGTFGFGSSSPLSRNVIEKGKKDSILITSSTNVAFNSGIAFAVWVTGLVIDAGYGYESAGWMGAALTTGGLMMAIASNQWKPKDALRQISASPIETKKKQSLCATVMSWFGCCYNDSQGDQPKVNLSMT
jgi:MFS transporter, DHA1 family, inner membrane transport protein